MRHIECFSYLCKEQACWVMPTFTLCRVDIYASICIVDTPVFFHADDWDSNISNAFLTKTD